MHHRQSLVLFVVFFFLFFLLFFPIHIYTLLILTNFPVSYLNLIIEGGMKGLILASCLERAAGRTWVLRER